MQLRHGKLEIFKGSGLEGSQGYISPLLAVLEHLSLIILQDL
jgi:hypothetical protein